MFERDFFRPQWEELEGEIKNSSLCRDESAKLDFLSKPDGTFTNSRLESIQTLLEVHYPEKHLKEVDGEGNSSKPFNTKML